MLAINILCIAHRIIFTASVARLTDEKTRANGRDKTLAQNSQQGYVMPHESCYRKEITMLQTIEAIIEPSGAIRLLEEVHVSSPKRALVTVLETPANEDVSSERGNAVAILKFLEENRLPESARLTAEEIDAQIEAERNAWD